MPQYLYLDIETLPTTDETVIAEIEKSITPPGNISKAETIAAWEKDKKPALVAEAVSKSALNGALGHVCCIGWAWGHEGTSAVTGAGEIDLLSHVFKMIEQGKPSGYERPVIVGHFVAGFDIRFLWQRAFVLGVRMPPWFPRDPKPWSQEVNDTMAMWAGARDSISLDNLCKALGLPGKGNIDGSMIADLWAKADYPAITEYCRQDVERVRQVHLKMLHAMGEVA